MGGGEPKGEPTLERGEPWRGGKAQESIGLRQDLKEGPPRQRTHAPEAKALKPSRIATVNGRRATRSREGPGWSWGKGSEGRTPRALPA
jgi:hypothetical protein